MSRLFAERAWHLVFGKRDDYVKYAMLEEQDRASSYRERPVVSVGGRGHLTPGKNPDIDKLLDSRRLSISGYSTYGGAEIPIIVVINALGGR